MHGSQVPLSILPKCITKSGDGVAIGWVAYLHDIYGASTGSDLSTKAQKEAANHELFEAMGIDRCALDRYTNNDGRHTDKDTLSPTPGIQRRTDEWDCCNRAYLIEERNESYPDADVAAMEIGLEIRVLKKSIEQGTIEAV